MSDSENVDDELYDTIVYLMDLADTDEETIWEQHGCIKQSQVCETLQGSLYKALRKGSGGVKDRMVTVKRTSKELHRQKVSHRDADGFSFVTAADITKEQHILRTLTESQHPFACYVAHYVDFFESFDDYFLVTECDEAAITLKRFVTQCHAYMKQRKLSSAEYARCVKYLCWQLFVTVTWLHESMKVCVLDLNTDNIMVENAIFVEQPHGRIGIHPDICMKISDFSVAEMFGTSHMNADDEKHDEDEKVETAFECEKFGLSLEGEPYLAPEVYANQVYDARRADSWSLGMILFECLANKPLYEGKDVVNMSNGYLALQKGASHLCQYLIRNHLHTHFTPKSVSLLSQLLVIDEKFRLHGVDLLRHAWFAEYCHKYRDEVNMIRSDLAREHKQRQPVFAPL